MGKELDDLLIQLSNGVFRVLDEEIRSLHLLNFLVHLLVDLLHGYATTPVLLVLNFIYGLCAVVSRGHVELTWLLWDDQRVRTRLHFQFKVRFEEILLFDIQKGKMVLLDLKKV